MEKLRFRYATICPYRRCDVPDAPVVYYTTLKAERKKLSKNPEDAEYWTNPRRALKHAEVIAQECY